MLPPAVILVMVGPAVMRQMMVAPLIFLGAWAAWSAAVNRLPGTWGQVVVTSFFGLASRLVLGFSGVPEGWVGAGGTIVASVVVPGILAAVNPALGLVGVFLGLVVTLHGGGPMAWVVIVAVLAVVWFLDWRGRQPGGMQGVAGLFPGLGAVMVVMVALGTWENVPLGHVLPGLNWIGGVILLVILAISLRLPPAAAGACALLACLMIGPTMVPTPEGGAIKLDKRHRHAPLRMGTGSSYLLDVRGEGLGPIGEGDKVATIAIGSRKLALRVHRDAAGRVGVVGPDLKNRPGVLGQGIWRPTNSGWRRADRVVLEVPEGVAPTITLRSGLPGNVVLRLMASGPSKPTSPRDAGADRWLWMTAAVVALLQLLSGLWYQRVSWVGWMLLTAGMIATRLAVEPFHLIVERHCVDLCLAAFLMAWVPAAAIWIRRERVFLAVAVFLVPMALAVPHLTPSLWGDEPYHIALMESVIKDHDLDLENNLGGTGELRKILLSSEHLFQSPVLAGLLLPTFLLAGRTGALIVLALGGAALVALVVRRYRPLRGPPVRAVFILVLIACTTFPLVTFSTQIWPGLLGALVVAAMLVLNRRGRGGRVVSAVLALVAVAAKTRMGLIALPVALAGWWRGNRRTRLMGLAVVGVATTGALIVGWLAMGHPFGFYRRFHHLIPGDPILALRVVGGLLFDVAGGLAWTAPLWLVALAAFPLLWRRGGDGERALLIGGGLTLLALLHSPEWYGGGSPPARYLVPMLPAVLLALGLLIAQPTGRRRVIVFLFPAAFFSWWALVTRPHFSVNPGDGRWWLTNALSRRFAADARSLFPSFLTPNVATLVVPLVLLGLGGIIWWICQKPRRAWWLVRVGPAVWLIFALGLVLAVDLRADTVVEAESAQIRRHGGRPIPPRGTVSRFMHPGGWRLEDGDALVFPLNLRGDERVAIEARILPPGWAGTLNVRWDDGVVSPLSIRRGRPLELIGVPGSPGPGRRRLHLEWVANTEAALFVDRVIVTKD